VKEPLFCRSDDEEIDGAILRRRSSRIGAKKNDLLRAVFLLQSFAYFPKPLSNLWIHGSYGLDAKEPLEARATLSRSSSVNAFWISSTSRDSKKGSPHWVQTHAGTESQDT